MLDSGSVGLMDSLNGLDMDLSIPMDLEMDLGSAGEDQPYQSLDQLGQSNISPLQDQELSAAIAHDMNAASAALPQAELTGAGAGPLPTGFGMPAPVTSSTLTEFTKRRNWSQRIIEELRDFLHILTADGRILYVSPSCKSLTGYEPTTLIGKFIGEYVHPDDSGIFMREFNESIASGNSLRFFYRFKKDDGTYVIFECDGHPHISPEQGQSQYGAASDGPAAGVCRGFFMMARPYPTKNAALLDSFLEHKMENERLVKRIEELKREEMEENAEQDRLYNERSAVMSASGATPSESAHNQSGAHLLPALISEEPASVTQNYQGMPPPAKPTISNTLLTRQNLDSALSAQKPDSIADKMSRYEANSTHLESIELLTGLQYRDGERSHGISTGDTSPALVRGDAGIAILMDRDRENAGKLKKKVKVADEYVCADCGTLDSPEWRKGPRGPKTLCNACGLRWAKKEKRRPGQIGDDDVGIAVGGVAGGVGMQMGAGNGGGMSGPGPPGYQQRGDSSGSS